MSRRTFLGVSLAAVTGLTGCGASRKSPGQLSKVELEAEIADRLKLRDVTLVEQGGGRFTGTGTDAEGKVFQLEVTQEQRRLSWKTTYKSQDGSSTSQG